MPLHPPQPPVEVAVEHEPAVACGPVRGATIVAAIVLILVVEAAAAVVGLIPEVSMSAGGWALLSLPYVLLGTVVGLWRVRHRTVTAGLASLGAAALLAAGYSLMGAPFVQGGVDVVVLACSAAGAGALGAQLVSQRVAVRPILGGTLFPSTS
jgi:hypothetical protein